MSKADHVMIRASAGSGKTHALTNRFVQLLALGAPPDRIVALTFTRKAAGEFFDEILNKLARAASDAGVALELAQAIELPQLRAGDFLRLLRLVIEAMPALRLGTLDGFFARIVRSFPLELGLAGDFELLEEHGARVERQRVLRQMFAHAGELDAAQKEFIEAFKRATFGRDEKRLGAQLDAFLDDHQEKYLAAPDQTLWGNQDKIWPEGSPWLGSKADIPEALRVLRTWVDQADLSDAHRERWWDFIAAAKNWHAGVKPPRELTYVLEKALAEWDKLVAGSARLKFERKELVLDAPASVALAEITGYLVSLELQRRIETTRGIYAVLHGYETSYHASVRRTGKLTFSDIQRLLMPENAPALTGENDEEGGRLFIDYRLDGEIDHWLLDEFQDTSVGQWSILRSLIDEAVQDPTGARSFFCVGDVKQAIFTWREGDPRLFQDILDHYNAIAPGTIKEQQLVHSWRSGPPLIAMVNEVFGAAAVIDELFPKAISAAWNRAWSQHHSAVRDRTGQAALLLGEDSEARWQSVVDIIRETRVLENGLSCAVLVQKNSTAAEWADILRRSGLPALAESDLHVCTDNPLGVALLALVRSAAHPGDSFAWEHLGMTPFAAVLRAEGIVTPSALAEKVLAQIHGEGFEPMVEAWLTALEPELEKNDSFTHLRARQFAEAARLFDQSGSRDTTEFGAFMERHTVRDAENAGVIRVMTIHKSKGLGFDVVFLPDLEGKKINQRRAGLAVQKNEGRSIDWVLDLPSAVFRENDAVLAKHFAGAEADAGYEALSLLYVAMTRAKRAMYALIKPPGKSLSLNYPRLLTESLGDDSQPIRVGRLSLAGIWSSGDPDWSATLKRLPVEAETDTKIPALDLTEIERAVRLPSRRPSDGKSGVMLAGPLFTLERNQGMVFGSAVHLLLAEVEWAEPGEWPLWEKKWLARGEELDVVQSALACLKIPELAPVWRRSAQPSERAVWRERSFEVVLDGVWFTGVFDRVVVEYDAGNATRATVVDFKTDKISGREIGKKAIARHKNQLHLYRRVAGLLSGLPAAKVNCLIVLTTGPLVAEVPHDR